MYLLTSYKYSLRFCSLLIMDAHQLIGFTDKKKFMIVKNNIYYACSGISYLEKFKNGLSNVENRIKSIKGRITFESVNGLKVKINLPI